MYGTDDIALRSLDPNWVRRGITFQRYWDMSPTEVRRQHHAPLLIVHRRNDFRCPMEQAEQLFIALMRLRRNGGIRPLWEREPRT
jgi:dipeptidyl aminopeptidase/acylaminoacyl peptidase